MGEKIIRIYISYNYFTITTNNEPLDKKIKYCIAGLVKKPVDPDILS